VKKMGRDTPASATPIVALSKTLPRFRADITPVATPPSNHSTAAPEASDRVTGRRSIRSGRTGFLVMNE
jgi:hypothetical protein